MKAGVRCTLCEAQENRRLDLSSLLASCKAACEGLRERRFKEESGRRGSNPRQPAWEAGTLPFRLTLLSSSDLSSDQIYLLVSDYWRVLALECPVVVAR